MKRTVAALAIALSMFLVQASNESDLDFDEFRDSLIRESKCLEKEGLTMEEVSKFSFEGNLKEVESKPQLKCFSACLFEHSGIMENCKINEEIFANDDMLRGMHELLMRCKPAIKAGDRCECAYELAKCMG